MRFCLFWYRWVSGWVVWFLCREVVVRFKVFGFLCGVKLSFCVELNFFGLWLESCGVIRWFRI